MCPHSRSIDTKMVPHRRLSKYFGFSRGEGNVHTLDQSSTQLVDLILPIPPPAKVCMYTYTIQRSASTRQLNNLHRGIYTICHLTRDFLRDFYFRNAEGSIATGLVK